MGDPLMGDLIRALETVHEVLQLQQERIDRLEAAFAAFIKSHNEQLPKT